MRDNPIPISVWTSVGSGAVTVMQFDSRAYRMTLSDGKQRVANSNPVVNIKNSGRGGLVDGAVAASTWYYTYLVPDVNNEALNAVASTVAPSGAGPTGYTAAWKYVGAFYVTAAKSLQKFAQCGDTFMFTDPSEFIAVGSLAGGVWTNGAWNKCNLGGYVPSTAGSVFMRGNGVTSNYMGGMAARLTQRRTSGNPVFTTDAGAPDNNWLTWSQDYPSAKTGLREFAFQDTLLSLWLYVMRGSGCITTSNVAGWRDQYLLEHR